MNYALQSPAPCGFDCAKCPVRIATITNGASPDGARCTGCMDPGDKYVYCAECTIRLRALGQN